MGRAVARVLAARGDTLCLLGRSPDSLERSAKDLEARGAAGRVPTLVCDLMEPERFGPALDEATSLLGGLDAVIMSAGLFGTQQALEEDAALRRSLLLGNFTFTIEFCEAARTRLLAAGGGTLCVFSSVAGERGRKPVGLYGATKAGLTRYLESLDHRHHGERLRVVTVKPGFVHTGMTAELDPPPFAGQPEAVAAQVVHALDAGHPVVYAPPIWRFVMGVIRQLPRFVMRRVGF
jgi:short-subunit dehydrogenase